MLSICAVPPMKSQLLSIFRSCPDQVYAYVEHILYVDTLSRGLRGLSKTDLKRILSICSTEYFYTVFELVGPFDRDHRRVVGDIILLIS